MAWHDRSARAQMGRLARLALIAVAAGTSCSTNEAPDRAIEGSSFEPLVAVPTEKILPSAGGPNHAFGNAVAFDGTTVVIGAPNFDNIGRAYVFRLSGADYVQEALLEPDNPNGVRDFGEAVAVDGDTIVVGAPALDGSRSGASFVFRRAAGTWAQEAELDPGVPTGALLGAAVDVDGDRVIVGAPHTEANDDGLAFVYLRSGSDWTLEDALNGEGALFGSDRFGQGVAIDGDTVAVGAPVSVLTGAGVGVFIFGRNGGAWPQVQKLPLGMTSVGRLFGWDVALSGTRLLVGCPSQTTSSVDPFVNFYEFEGSAWQLVATFDQPSSATRSFGQSVSLDGDTAWVGAPLADAVGTNSGLVSVFTRAPAAWTLLEEIVATDTVAQDMFGTSVAGLGRTAVVGVPGDDDDGAASGSAWAVVLKGELGEACTVDDGCASGFCVDEVCCESACGGQLDDCQACSQAAGAAQDGQCQPISGTACDDGNPCTEAETCSSGACVGGDLIQCEPLDACHEPGTCEKPSGCSNPVSQDGKPCPGGTCLSGVCTLPDGGTAGGGGSAGAGGTAGAAGSGGTAGAAGSGGTAGSAGSGGMAGTAGSGGNASGGTGGTGGDSGSDAGPSTAADDGVETSGFYACSYASSPKGGAAYLAALGLLLGVMRRRRRLDR
jgi:uncharacterized protein (TIGR03382 family)